MPEKPKIYLKPKHLPPAKQAELTKLSASGRARAIRGVHRGTIVPPKAKKTTVPEMNKIEFLPDGRVKKTRLREKDGKPGEFEKGKIDEMKNAQTALRQASHKIKSLGSEIERELEAQRDIAGVHAEIKNKWNRMNPNQKESVKNYLLGIMNGLSKNPGAVKRTEKRKALNAIKNAIELLEEKKIGGYPAACAGLVGASNSLIAQINVLRSQRTLIASDKTHYQRKSVKTDEDVAEATSKLIEAQKQLGIMQGKGRHINRVKGLINLIANIQARHPGFVEARKPLLDAMQSLKADPNKKWIHNRMQEAMKIILREGSKSSRYSKETIVKARLLSTPREFAEIARNQLEIMADNVEYWFEKSEPKQRKRIKQWLYDLSEEIGHTKLESLRPKINLAGRLIGRENPAESKRILKQVVEIMNDTLAGKSRLGELK